MNRYQIPKTCLKLWWNPKRKALELLEITTPPREWPLRFGGFVQAVNRTTQTFHSYIDLEDFIEVPKQIRGGFYG